MGTAVVVSANTKQLLERAVAKLDVLGHRIAAAEIRETQERKDAQARADAAAYLTSREHLLDVQAVQRECQRRRMTHCSRGARERRRRSLARVSMRIACVLSISCKNACPRTMNIDTCDLAAWIAACFSSEAPMRFVDPDIREHNPVMTVVGDKPSMCHRQ